MDNIYQYLGQSFTCPDCGKEHRLPIKKVESHNNAFNYAVEFIRQLDASIQEILILCDQATYDVAAKQLNEVLEPTFRTDVLILTPTEYKKVYADESYFPQIREKASGKQAIITVGTGSITDLGKYVGHELHIPVIAFPTAPSMNAYTSGVCAFLGGGVKQTISLTPCTAVLIDQRIISEAPMILIQSGFADSLAKSFANADWQINSILTGEEYCTLPLKITTAAEKKYKTLGAELLERNPAVIDSLMEGLTMGGFSMVLAGKSAPASGGEHLISHTLDMYAHRNHQEVYSYHGLQVGLGILSTALLFEKLKAITKPTRRSIDYGYTIQGYFKDESATFLKSFASKSNYLAYIDNHWAKIHHVCTQVPSYHEVLGYLKSTQCPTRFSDIGVSPELAKHIIGSARYIRNRITVLDLADELGVMDAFFQESKNILF
jgi:glycerol-1-phosphate dehydrogenase [NAD(P)+]